ncbi:MAG: amino acid adenylation domain-containing protein [Methylovulum sp.]|nr:amino acid adenylation domain-containing protein [Methylovulum sp.]
MPLSYAQQRLWFLDQWELNSASYTIPIALRLKGQVNLPALTQSLDEIIRRHESLRTVFTNVNGQARQTVLSKLALFLNQADLTGLSEPIRQTIAQDLCRQEPLKPFALATGPLVRVVLLCLNDDPIGQDYALLVSLHHIVSDGWSSAILTREFAALYQAFSIGRPSPLPELGIQYADFAHWQRQWLSGAILHRQLDYWQQQLDGVPELLDLPSDYPRPPIMACRGANYTFTIPPDVSDSCQSLGRQQNVTLFMILLAVFKVLLFRYSHQQDICVGTPVANRNKRQLEELIGFFVNALALRSHLSGTLPFSALLAQVRNTVLDAQTHQDLPFEQIVEALKIERNKSFNPIFQVWFSLQIGTGEALAIPGLSIGNLEGENSVAKFDLALHLQTQASGAITGVFEYNTDLFKPATIVRWAGHYLSLLQGIVTQPQAYLGELPLLTAAERHYLLVTCNDTYTEIDTDRCLHSLFEEQVAKTPDAPALACGGQTLSYAELNAKANQLAHFLRGKGVMADSQVGLCAGRSVEMVIGLLGILKAGGAYVPMDPDYPDERLRYMMDDTQAKVLLTQTALLKQLPCSAETVSLDNPELSLHSPHNPLSHNDPQNLAYIIYTSGSTGQPKGVMVTHRNAVHSTLARFTAYPTTVQAYLLLSSFAFDSSVAGIFWTLSQGGCLCLPSQDAAKDPSLLGALISERQVSHLLALPSFYALLLKQIPTQLQTLKTAIVAGEACATDVVKQHYAVLPDAALYNEYGPTEATVWSSVYRANHEDTQRPLSIGRPIDNVLIYLLDSQYSPVPIGAQGELFIGGAGLTRGYLHHPELTAEKFIPDPFNGSGKRLYKTGDLARLRPDGNIEFLGRVDQQVKLRGFRIELGEIETQLLAHPGVAETAVLVREDQPSNPQLIAYIASNPDALLDAVTLRQHLKHRLPDYMLPAAFIFLEHLPLSANGKLDRKNLPAPDAETALKTSDCTASTATETKLAELWAALLNIPQADKQANFFDLGGHSLLAIELLFTIQQTFNTELTLVDLFEHPTLAEQAQLLDGDGATEPQQQRLSELEADAELDPGIQPLEPTATPAAGATAVLLTGATGFLGAFILAELLKQTQGIVYCLVRATTEQEAEERLRQQLIRYELPEVCDFQRIIPVCGDLSSPRLGLNQLRYQEIATNVGAIYHNGALVNFIQPYRALKAANVLGTQEVLRLACTEKAKIIHYVSTLSVFSEQQARHPQGFQEQDEPLLTAQLANGYAQSKWVAEKLVKTASDRGFQVSIYRPATVAGDSLKGVWNVDDFYCRLLKGCIQLGFAPEGDSRMDMAPVDYMARAIVALSLQPSAMGAVFHLNHPSPPSTRRLLDWFMAHGYPLEVLPWQTWLEKLHEKSGHITDFALTPLLSLFPTASAEAENTDSDSDAGISYDCTATQNQLNDLGIDCPPIDQTLLACYHAYFLHSGFLKPGSIH